MSPQYVIFPLIAFTFLLTPTSGGLLDAITSTVPQVLGMTEILRWRTTKVLSGDSASVTPEGAQPYIDLPEPHDGRRRRRKRSSRVSRIIEHTISHDCVKAKTLPSKRVTNLKAQRAANAL